MMLLLVPALDTCFWHKHCSNETIVPLVTTLPNVSFNETVAIHRKRGLRKHHANAASFRKGEQIKRPSTQCCSMCVRHNIPSMWFCQYIHLNNTDASRWRILCHNLEWEYVLHTKHAEQSYRALSLSIFLQFRQALIAPGARYGVSLD